MKIVVADTRVIISLIHIQRIDLIDDNKARLIAEYLDINCIGTLGLLLKARQKGLIAELKPLFEKLLKAGRYFSRELLSEILIKIGESRIN